MFSMTGYGKAVETFEGKELTIEMKSVNHRFLDINTRLPKLFASVEDVLRKTIQDNVSRGRIDVFLTYVDRSESEKNVTVDMGLAKAYVAVAKKLVDTFSVEDDLTLTALMRLPEVVRQESEQEDRDTLAKLVYNCTLSAIKKMNEMKKNEGEKLREDILARVSEMKKMLSEIEISAPKVAEIYREKLTARMTDILSDVNLDEGKLLSEVAFYSDKSNIDEEITRLKSHFIQCENILSKEVYVGRKLDFLIQEFNRECNTICSKSNDITLTNISLKLKSEIEKVREQVQNLE